MSSSEKSNTDESKLLAKNKTRRLYRSKSLSNLKNYVLKEVTDRNNNLQIHYHQKRPSLSVSSASEVSQLFNFNNNTPQKRPELTNRMKDNLRLRLLKMRYKNFSFDSDLKERADAEDSSVKNKNKTFFSEQMFV